MLRTAQSKDAFHIEAVAAIVSASFDYALIG
jgi:hypothetical protein